MGVVYPNIMLHIIISQQQGFELANNPPFKICLTIKNDSYLNNDILSPYNSKKGNQYYRGM